MSALFHLSLSHQSWNQTSYAITWQQSLFKKTLLRFLLRLAHFLSSSHGLESQRLRVCVLITAGAYFTPDLLAHQRRTFPGLACSWNGISKIGRLCLKLSFCRMDLKTELLWTEGALPPLWKGLCRSRTDQRSAHHTFGEGGFLEPCSKGCPNKYPRSLCCLSLRLGLQNQSLQFLP